MIGLPGETDADIDECVALHDRAVEDRPGRARHRAVLREAQHAARRRSRSPASTSSTTGSIACGAASAAAPTCARRARTGRGSSTCSRRAARPRGSPSPTRRAPAAASRRTNDAFEKLENEKPSRPRRSLAIAACLTRVLHLLNARGGDESEVLASNEAFYDAFNTRDIDAMDRLWAKLAPVVCLHPGSTALHGRSQVIRSWHSILSSDGAPRVAVEGPRVVIAKFALGETAMVLCYERVHRSRHGHGRGPRCDERVRARRRRVAPRAPPLVAPSAASWHGRSLEARTLHRLAAVAFVVVARGRGLQLRDGREGGGRRRACTPECLVRPDYAGADRIAPDFTLKDMKGRDVKLSDYRGKVVVLNFWTKTCGPCLKEMPSLAELTQMLADRKDVVVLAVSTDEGPADVADTLKSVLAREAPFRALRSGRRQRRGREVRDASLPRDVAHRQARRRARAVRRGRDWANPAIVELVDQFGDGTYCPLHVDKRVDKEGAEAERPARR